MSRIDTIDMHMSIDPDKITGRDAADLIRIINGFLEEKQGELGAKNEEEKEEVKKKIKAEAQLLGENLHGKEKADLEASSEE